MNRANRRYLPRSFIFILMPKTQRTLVRLFVFLLAACLFAVVPPPALYAQASQKPDPNAVPVIDGGIGPCTADFTITDNAGAPVYDATIKVHISYGVFHKLDLQVGTNSNGKARFTGLPEKTKRGLFLRASKGERTGSAFDDTAKTCNGQFTVALRPTQPQ
jgi:hypothetical protein